MERTFSATDDTSICSKCGHENLYYSLRCARCGAALPLGEAREIARPFGAALGGVVGRGAYSTVYRLDGERPIALKVFRGLDGSTASHARREVGALSRIDHAGVARLVGVGHVAGATYIAMPFYEGPTLRELVDRRGGLGLEPIVATRVAAGLASALEAVHGSGFVHRDVKPENVIVTSAGPVLLDFGFAERSAPAEGPCPATRVAGTLPYIAPEHLAGAHATPASDRFALGCIVFEMLAGRAPFGEGGVVRAILEGRPGPLPRDVPSELAELTYALLDREPDARPATVARRLCAFLRGADADADGRDAGDRAIEPASDTASDDGPASSIERAMNARARAA